MMKKFIILDRDGVINDDSDDYIKSPEEWIPIPGSLEAIAHLKQAGYTIAVVTNQSGVALGLYSETTLQLIHEKMQNALKTLNASIDAIFYCPHKAADHCNCRKPKPGMFYQVADYFKIALTGLLYIGDKKSDVEAAQAAGCNPVLVRTGYGEETLLKNPHLHVPVFNDLAEAVAALLNKTLDRDGRLMHEKK